MIYLFTIPIAPKGQKRDRIATVGGHARSYTDAGQKHYEAKIRALLAGDAPQKPIEGAVNLHISCYLPIPASWSRKKRLLALQSPPLPSIRPTVKPDIDNIAKQMLDCMNGLILLDDKQVVGLFITKWYSDNPRWEITVEEIG